MFQRLDTRIVFLLLTVAALVLAAGAPEGLPW